MINFKRDKYGVGTIILDMDDRKVNIINHQVAKIWQPLLDFLEDNVKQGVLKGVIITSAKNSFLAGGDLDYLHKTKRAEDVYQHTATLRAIFRRIENMGIPFVAAINGAALGSGYELALACHYRIALDKPKTLIGLPEVTLGMMPVGGAIARLTRLLGFEKAFNILSVGKQMHVKEALKRSLIDEIVPDEIEMLIRANEWIHSNPDFRKPWDKPDYVLPKSQDPTWLPTAKEISVINARIVKKTRNNYPAIQSIFNSMIEGLYLTFDASTRIESRYFTSLVMSSDCRNLTQAYWYDINRIKSGMSRPQGYSRFKVRTITIIGSGKMGSGIAYLAALRGITVYMKDVSLSTAQQGKAMVENRLKRIVKAQKMTEGQMNEILAFVKPTDSFEVIKESDLIIESVFESETLKRRIIKDVHKYMHSDAILATNTSTIGISNLATSIKNPENYVGLHFFDPVTKIPMIEVIKGEQTSEETVAKAFDFARQIKKIPIIIKDSLAFYTTRISRVYILEAFNMLLEGHSAAAIEQAAIQAGMKYPPLFLADAIGLQNILALEEKVIGIFGDIYKKLKGVEVVERMVHDFDRRGMNSGDGFYSYNNGKKEYLWRELSDHFPMSNDKLDQNTVMERLLFVQCLEAIRCMNAGMIATSEEANLGSIFGAGFADFKGGVLQYINDYGIDAFNRRANELAELYGWQFMPPKPFAAFAEEM